jgi:acetoin utilization deacetylase AcuC-like enzyme
MQWRKHCQQVMKKMKAFKPDLVLVSAGFDAHMNDTFGEGHINLNNQDYYWIANELTTEFPRVVSVLEGGYDIDVLSMCCTSHIQGLGV